MNHFFPSVQLGTVRDRKFSLVGMYMVRLEYATQGIVEILTSTSSVKHSKRHLVCRTLIS